MMGRSALLSGRVIRVDQRSAPTGAGKHQAIDEAVELLRETSVLLRAP
jgi:hypothetical protein